MTDPESSQRCLAYIEAHLRQGRKPGHPPAAPTITLSRLTGSGGIPIAERLAAFLQKHRPGKNAPWTVFHRSLVERVLEDHNLPAKLGDYMPEDRVSYIQDTMEELLGLHPSRTSLVTQVTETVLGLAELGNCILIGRGANFILAKDPRAFHVRLVSDLVKRIDRVRTDKGMTDAEAKDFIQREDTARARYVKSHFDASIDDPLTYHLVLNTEWFSADEAAETIGHAILRHFPAAA